METKQLGNTGVTISAIGLGGMPMSLSDRPSEMQAIEVIHRALDLGVTLIDTADSYCKDESDKHHNERLISKALKQYQGDNSHVIVATKGGLMRPNGSWTRNGNPEHLRQTIKVSFESLGREKPIDVWQYHAPAPNYTIEESLTPAKEAVAAGLIRFVGVSNFSVDQIKRAREIVDIVSVQNQYNPWQRQPAKVVSGDAGKDAEIRQLERKLARVTEERDIPKEATAYFAGDVKLDTRSLPSIAIAFGMRAICRCLKPRNSI